MRKITVSLLFVITLIISLQTVSARTEINYDTKETTFIDGVKHTEIVGSITKDGKTTPQVINYMGVNPTTRDDLHIVTGDYYRENGWGMMNLEGMVQGIHDKYPNYEVIGGVNGDFYNMSVGYPVEVYINNYEVISQGLGYERTVIGFKDNGEVMIGRPCFEGYTLTFIDNEGDIIHKLDVDNVNNKDVLDTEISVYFDIHLDMIEGNVLVLDSIDQKYDDYHTRFFGKGIFLKEERDYTINENEIVLKGVDKELVDNSTYILVQNDVGCGFEEVRYAIGAWETLVQNGKAVDDIPEGAGPTLRHPRTAIGVKEDGTVFFVTIDGRNYDLGMYGVTEYELADIMVYFGAEEAYNLDGGGSTTMILKQEDGTYNYMNTPSDGQPRNVSNGLFIAKGEHLEKPLLLPYPDNRSVLDSPLKVYVDSFGIIRFNTVTDATSYEVTVNGVVYSTNINSLTVLLEEGKNTIKVRAKGNKLTHKESPEVDIEFYEHNDKEEKIIELFKGISSTKNSD